VNIILIKREYGEKRWGSNLTLLFSTLSGRTPEET
jgi:hypothetical protein